MRRNHAGGCDIRGRVLARSGQGADVRSRCFVAEAAPGTVGTWWSWRRLRGCPRPRAAVESPGRPPRRPERRLPRSFHHRVRRNRKGDALLGKSPTARPPTAQLLLRSGRERVDCERAVRDGAEVHTRRQPAPASDRQEGRARLVRRHGHGEAAQFERAGVLHAVEHFRRPAKRRGVCLGRRKPERQPPNRRHGSRWRVRAPVAARGHADGALHVCCEGRPRVRVQPRGVADSGVRQARSLHQEHRRAVEALHAAA